MSEAKLINSIIFTLNESEKFLDLIFDSKELVKYIFNETNFLWIGPKDKLTLKKTTVIYQSLNENHDTFLRKIALKGNCDKVFNIYTELNKVIKRKINELINTEIEDTIENPISTVFTIRYYEFFISNFFKYFDTSLFSLIDICKIINISHEFGTIFTTVVIHNCSSYIPCVDNFLNSEEISDEHKKMIISYVENKFELFFEKPLEIGLLKKVFNYCHRTKYENIYPFSELSKIRIISFRTTLENYFINNDVFEIDF